MNISIHNQWPITNPNAAANNGKYNFQMLILSNMIRCFRSPVFMFLTRQREFSHTKGWTAYGALLNEMTARGPCSLYNLSITRQTRSSTVFAVKRKCILCHLLLLRLPPDYLGSAKRILLSCRKKKKKNNNEFGRRHEEDDEDLCSDTPVDRATPLDVDDGGRRRGKIETALLDTVAPGQLIFETAPG